MLIEQETEKVNRIMYELNENINKETENQKRKYYKILKQKA